MKTTPSRYILAGEILIIVLFHAVKIRQAEKQPAETAYTQYLKNTPLQKPIVDNKTDIEYLLLNLAK
jgi:hypothetical protein